MGYKEDLQRESFCSPLWWIIIWPQIITFPSCTFVFPDKSQKTIFCFENNNQSFLYKGLTDFNDYPVLHCLASNWIETADNWIQNIESGIFFWNCSIWLLIIELMLSIRCETPNRPRLLLYSRHSVNGPSITGNIQLPNFY